MYTLEDTLFTLAATGEVDSMLYICLLKDGDNVLARTFKFGSFGNIDKIMSEVGLANTPTLPIFTSEDVSRESNRVGITGKTLLAY